MAVAAARAGAARDDADRVEAEWQSLLLRLQDIGFVPPDGATPRQASRTIGHDAYLTPDENDALGRVVTTLERARYARPGADLVDVTDDARTVWRGALSRRRRTDRARALLLPEEGKQMWRGLGRSLLFWRRPEADGPARRLIRSHRGDVHVWQVGLVPLTTAGRSSPRSPSAASSSRPRRPR